jgi:hypothetical protein
MQLLDGEAVVLKNLKPMEERRHFNISIRRAYGQPSLPRSGVNETRSFFSG